MMIDFLIYKQQFESDFDSINEWLLSEFAKLRIGKANPAILDDILVHAYDDKMPINQLANLSIPDPRTLVIKPYDKSTLKDIAAAINAANIGINPQVDADVIRLTFKAPTEDDRKLLVKKAKSLAEDAKIKVRRSRQNLQDEFKKDANALEDDKKYFQNELDSITKNFNKKIEEELAKREKEIMTI